MKNNRFFYIIAMIQGFRIRLKSQIVNNIETAKKKEKEAYTNIVYAHNNVCKYFIHGIIGINQ